MVAALWWEVPGLQIETVATVEPISLELAQEHLNLDVEGSPPVSDWDGWLETFAIAAVRRNAEKFLGLSLAQQTYRLTLDALTLPLELPLPPLVSVTSIKYDDLAGDEQTLSTGEYQVDITRRIGVVRLATDGEIPSINAAAGSVRVLFVAGYEPDEIPQDIVAGMLMLLAHLFKNREAVTTERAAFVLPLSVNWLLRPYRIRIGMA